MRQRTAVHRAVAAEMEAAEARGATDPAVVGDGQVDGHLQDVAAVGQVHPPARRRVPLVGVVGRQQAIQLVERVGGLGDHLVGSVCGAGVVLQLADGVDEPAVVGATAGGRYRRVEPAADVLVDVVATSRVRPRMLRCHAKYRIASAISQPHRLCSASRIPRRTG